MSPRRTTRWPAGAPTWVDVSTPDLDAAQVFYGSLLGWTFGERDPDFGGYCMALSGDGLAAGMGPVMDPAAPPAWTLYFGTDDIDAAARTVTGSGGSVLAGVMDVGDAGRMLVAADPSGAVFGLWDAKQMSGLEVFNEPGGLFWEDLRSSDPDTARGFYHSLFGWDYQSIPEAGPDYATFHHAGDPAPLGGSGGMMGMQGFPSHWVVYFGVREVDAAIAQTEELGGHVLSTGFDTPYGRMGAVTDPFGAAFWVMTPHEGAPQPDRSG